MEAGKIGAVVLAAGRGTRMMSSVEKQYLLLAGYPLGYYCLAALEDKVDEIVLVSAKGEEQFCYDTLVRAYGLQKVKKVVAGGRERYHSVYEGLRALSGCDYVLIQDSARPCLTPEIIDRCIGGAKKYGACVAAVPSKDTIKEVSPDGYALRTPPRSSLWVIQTPQAFSYSLIMDAYTCMMREENENSAVTDDAMVVEQFSDRKVHMVEGSYENIKVTTPEDLAVAELYLRRIGKVQ